ncbi:MAG: hypothetical protein WAK29_09900 [Terriglobales bacterium]
MASKAQPIPKNCVKTAIRIGEAIAALEVVGRIPAGELRSTMTSILEQRLSRLNLRVQRELCQARLQIRSH